MAWLLRNRWIRFISKHIFVIIGVALIIEALLIYINRDQFDFAWWKSPPPEQAVTVPDDPYIDLVNAGNGYLGDNDNVGATKSFDAAIALNPERPEAYTSKSIIATSTEEMRLLNLALSKAPYGYAYEFRADAYNRQDKYDLALADATKAIESGVYTYRVYKYRAADYLNFSKYAEALSDSQQAELMEPDDGQSLTLEGMALYGLGKCKDAEDAFYEAVDVSRGDVFEVNARNRFTADMDASTCKDN